MDQKTILNPQDINPQTTQQRQLKWIEIRHGTYIKEFGKIWQHIHDQHVNSITSKIGQQSLDMSTFYSNTSPNDLSFCKSC